MVRKTKDSIVNPQDITLDNIGVLFEDKKRASNQRKILAPIFICDFLKENVGKKFTQDKIKKMLLNQYGVKLERKSVSRILHTLHDEGIGVVCLSDEGCYFDPDAKVSNYYAAWFSRFLFLGKEKVMVDCYISIHSMIPKKVLESYYEDYLTSVYYLDFDVPLYFAA